jgi:hypothetical protein
LPIWRNFAVLIVMKYFNYILIACGACVAFYAKAGKDQNQIILIIGIVILMLGVYRLAATIPSKKKEDTFVKEEQDELQ